MTRWRSFEIAMLVTLPRTKMVWLFPCTGPSGWKRPKKNENTKIIVVYLHQKDKNLYFFIILFFSWESNPQPPNFRSKRVPPKKICKKGRTFAIPPTLLNFWGKKTYKELDKLGRRRLNKPWVQTFFWTVAVTLAIFGGVIIRRLASLGTLTYIIGVMNT